MNSNDARRKVYNFELVHRGDRVIARCLHCGCYIAGATLPPRSDPDADSIEQLVQVQMGDLIREHHCYKWYAVEVEKPR